MILIIDNFDSFTYNIAQYFQVLQQDLTVWKNNQATLDDITKLAPDAIVIGPGPCTPDDAGISLSTIESFAGKIPTLGVCLGHQAIGQVFGGDIVAAKQIMHGRISTIHHTGKGIFNDVPSSFNATRYHSLVIDSTTLPSCLEVTAWTEDSTNQFDEIMAIRHRDLPIEGIQFHPESILSEAGYHLFNNFLIRHKLSVLSNADLPLVSG